MKTNELTRAALDWAVANCEPNTGMSLTHVWREACGEDTDFLIPKYSTDWSQGGPIIEREQIELKVLADCFDVNDHPTYKTGDLWEANIWPADMDMIECCGPTPLIAAMRCYVASKLGDEVEIPEEVL